MLQKDPPQKVDMFQDTENFKDAQEYGKNTKFDFTAFFCSLDTVSTFFGIHFPNPFLLLLSPDKFYIQYINHVSQDLENLKNSIIQYIQVKLLCN